MFSAPGRSHGQAEKIMDDSRPMKFAFVNIAGSSGVERQRLIKKLKDLQCNFYELPAPAHVQNGLPEPIPTVHLTNGQQKPAQAPKGTNGQQKPAPAPNGTNGPKIHGLAARSTLNVRAPVFEMRTEAERQPQGIQLLAPSQAREPCEELPQPPQNAWSSSQHGSSLFKNHDQSKETTSQRPVKGNGNFSHKGSVDTPDCKAGQNMDQANPAEEAEEDKLIIAAIADWLQSPVDMNVEYNLPLPQGLKNGNRNSCYINALLQAMFGLNEFATVMSSLAQTVQHYCLDRTEERFPLVISLIKQWKDYSFGDGGTGEGLDLHLTRHLGVFNNEEIQAGQQGDPGEFFMGLVNKIQEELRNIKKERVGMFAVEGEKLQNLISRYHLSADADEEASNGQRDEDEGGWQQVKVGRRAGRRQLSLDRNCPFHQIFGGVNVYDTFNRVGEHIKTSRADAYVYMSVPVSDPDISTVEDAMNKLHSRQPFENESFRKTVLNHIPRILFIQLANWTVENGKINKISKQILLQEVVKVNPEWCMPTLRNEVVRNGYQYRLVSGFFHLGGSHKAGHYIAFQARPPTATGSSNWVIFDDSRVYYVHPSAVLNYHAETSFNDPTAMPYGLMFRLEWTRKKTRQSP